MKSKNTLYILFLIAIISMNLTINFVNGVFYIFPLFIIFYFNFNISLGAFIIFSTLIFSLNNEVYILLSDLNSLFYTIIYSAFFNLLFIAVYFISIFFIKRLYFIFTKSKYYKYSFNEYKLLKVYNRLDEKI